MTETLKGPGLRSPHARRLLGIGAALFALLILTPTALALTQCQDTIVAGSGCYLDQTVERSCCSLLSNGKWYREDCTVDQYLHPTIHGAWWTNRVGCNATGIECMPFDKTCGAPEVGG